jgi:hypothetical protein
MAESSHLITSFARREWNLALTISNQTLNFNLRLYLWHSQCHWNPTQCYWHGFHIRYHNIYTENTWLLLLIPQFCHWFAENTASFRQILPSVTEFGTYSLDTL